MAFTFTEKAAESIKRRVSQALSASGLDPTVLGAMYIGTIHSYCQHVLGKMDVTYRQYDVLDENRLKLYLISRYGRLRLQHFRDRARGKSYFDTIKQTSDAWKTANDELLDFAAVAQEDPDLGDLLVRIQDSLRADQYIDFSLMIREVVEALHSRRAEADRAVEGLRHLMVDEYQDVNPAQEELIKLLHERSETLFVVGDDDQAIYAWRGADVQNILTFQQRYPSASTHTLSTNFRSTSPIVKAADQFAASQLGPSRIPKNPQAALDRTPQDFRVLWFPDRAAEAEWVAERIRDLLGTAYDDNGSIRGLTRRISPFSCVRPARMNKTGRRGMRRSQRRSNVLVFHSAWKQAAALLIDRRRRFFGAPSSFYATAHPIGTQWRRISIPRSCRLTQTLISTSWSASSRNGGVGFTGRRVRRESGFILSSLFTICWKRSTSPVQA